MSRFHGRGLFMSVGTPRSRNIRCPIYFSIFELRDIAGTAFPRPLRRTSPRCRSCCGGSNRKAVPPITSPPRPLRGTSRPNCPPAASASRRFRRRLDYLDIPARIRHHGFFSIVVPVDDVVIAHEADDSAGAVKLMVTSPAQHRDPFVAQHTALAYYPTTDRPNAHADSLLERTTVLGLARSVDTVCRRAATSPLICVKRGGSR